MLESDNYNLSITSAPSCVTSLDELTTVGNFSVNTTNKIAVLKALLECSIDTGGYVQLSADIGYLPALIGKDSRPVYLYQLVELFDEIIDYDKILEEYPTLSYSQVGGAIAFLRKISQTNATSVDIDELEDECDFEDAELLDELRKALNDEEIARVFPED